ncbi:MAG: hypothetical protein ACXVB4_14825 [Pseudobdellovibrionaceae bacterium]
MKIFKTALLGISLFPLFAMASPTTRCYPKIRFQGEIATVTVIGGGNSAQATLVYGNSQESKSQKYQVVQTESADLRYSYYNAPDFYLAVDTTEGRGELKAKLDQENIRLSGLKCEIHAMDPHPGVTMGN